MASSFKPKRSSFDSARKSIQEKIKRSVSGPDAKLIGEKLISEMKTLIKAGISPVVGGGFGGRFPGYKNPAKYPGDKKTQRPVNLELTGQQLESLTSRSTKNGVEIKYGNDTARKKESGHREGVNSQPKRPTIPDPTKGETFSDSILTRFKSEATKLIKKTFTK